MYDKQGILKDRREMLRVKAKSLAEEARIIRREERRAKGGLADELRTHRREIVRYEARATFMAYGMVRGKPIDRIERAGSPRSAAFWSKVAKMIERYGPIEPTAKAALTEMCALNATP